MARSARMFEIIQMLRTAQAPLTAEEIARRLEVNKRTVYRDIAALQATRVPVEGAAGIGYVLRNGFDLPPLMFTPEEIEAITVGLSLIARTGDRSLEAAGANAIAKIDAVLPPPRPSVAQTHLFVSPWHAIPAAKVGMRLIRQAIREERKLQLRYRDQADSLTERIVCPLAIVYYIEGVLLAGFCELRNGFRHFRQDRIEACDMLDIDFSDTGAGLRKQWRETHDIFYYERQRGAPGKPEHDKSVMI